MRKIRIHNDIVIFWHIITNGEEVSLEGRELKVTLKDEQGYIRTPLFNVSGNTISFTWRGADQRNLGVYTLILEDVTGGKKITIDHICAFALVAHTIEESRRTDNVEITSYVDVFKVNDDYYPTRGEGNMNNALESGVYPWCTLGRPAGSDGAFTLFVRRSTSPDNNGYYSIIQLAIGRSGNTFGHIYMRTIFVRPQDTIYGDWVDITDKGVVDYNALTNKPAINGITLNGNKSADELQLVHRNIFEDAKRDINKFAENVENRLNALQDDIAKREVERAVVSGDTLIIYLTNGYTIEFKGGEGVSDYNALTNHPSVNGITLVGDKTSADLKVTGSEEFDEYKKTTSSRLGNVSTNLENLHRTLYDQEVGSIPTMEKDIEGVKERVDELQLFKYPNATIKGDLTINHGQVSGFARENYLVLPFALDLAGKGWELNLALTTGEDVTTAQNIIGSNFCVAMYVQSGQLTTRISTNGTSWGISKVSSFGIEANKIYYVRLTHNRLQYALSYSTDGKEYASDWVEVNPNSPAEGLVYMGVGMNLNNPFGGIINLNKCSLLINNQHYWEGMDDAGLATRLATDLSNIDEEGVSRLNDLIYESDLSKDVQANDERIFNAQGDIQVLQNKVADIETSKDLGVIVVGNPNIKGSQVSGFSANNYLMMPRVIEFGSNTWQLDFQFTTGADVTQQQNLIDSQYGLALAIRNGHIVVAMSSTGAGWNMGEHTGESALSANTSYYVRMTFDGGKYEVFISTDGKIFTPDIEVVSSATLSPVQIYIGKSLDNAHIFGGSIYLYYASLSIAGTIIWTGTLGGELKDEVHKLEREVGDLSALQTQEKSNLVGAINEIKQGGGGGSSDIDRNLGKYTTNEQYASLSIAQNGKAISKEGVVINKSGYAISNEIPVTKGHLYLFKSSINVSDVSLFANKIVGNIVYIDTHETITLEDGARVTRITTRTTTKGEDLKSHTYTYVYNADNFTDTPNDIKEGNVSKGASFVFPTQYTEYEPIFSANGTAARPIDGYYVLAASVTGNLVISANASDIKGYLIECIYGALKSITNNLARKADVDVISTLYKRGVVGQTQTWTSDHSSYTMSNQVWGVIPQANIDLFVSAGAEFNDADAPKPKQAPWGEQVQHLPGYFYLNGLGDISYNEMQKIYNQTNHLKNSTLLTGAFSGEKGIFSCRTNIPYNLLWDGVTNTIIGTSVAVSTPMEVFVSNRESITFDWMTNSFTGSRLQYMVGNINMANIAAEARMPVGMSSSLKYVRLKGIKYSMRLYSKFLDNSSILYMVQNSVATSTITITLHADVYTRAMADDEIRLALESHPLITLARA